MCAQTGRSSPWARTAVDIKYSTPIPDMDIGLPNSAILGGGAATAKNKVTVSKNK